MWHRHLRPQNFWNKCRVVSGIHKLIFSYMSIRISKPLSPLRLHYSNFLNHNSRPIIRIALNWKYTNLQNPNSRNLTITTVSYDFWSNNNWSQLWFCHQSIIRLRLARDEWTVNSLLFAFTFKSKCGSDKQPYKISVAKPSLGFILQTRSNIEYSVYEWW